MSEDNIQILKKEYSDSPERNSISMELINLISSEKTASQITDICLRNGVEDEEKIEEISYRIAWAILDRFPKENLASILKDGVGLQIEAAEKISTEVNTLIFSQISKPQPPTEPEKPAPIPLPKKREPVEKPLRPSKKDTYREPVE